MSKGLIFIDRGIFDHPMFDAGHPLTEREAWLWMLCRAYWKPGKRRVGNVMVSLKRGQFTESMRYLADTWHWDKMRVSRYIKLLESETMIETARETESGTGQTVITICNYDKFQNTDSYRETAQNTPDDTPVIQQRDSTAYTNETETRQTRKPKQNQDSLLERDNHPPRTRADEPPPDNIDALGQPQRPVIIPAVLDRRVLTEQRVIETVARVKFVGNANAPTLVAAWLDGGATLNLIHDIAISAMNTAGADRDWMIAQIDLETKGPKDADDDDTVTARRQAILDDLQQPA